jgi:serine/threonine protein kinase
MTPERLKKVEEIYHAVLEISPSTRKQFLQSSCGDDVELRKEVESLLSFEKTFASIIDSSPQSLVEEVFSEEKHSILIGTTINQYKILSLLGEGGMGSVFLAQDTKLERKVAIKFLANKLSKDSNRLNRFFQEAKAASALNHPNIITVYEIGDVENKPFIVSEFIDGKTLTDFLFLEELKLSRVLEIATQIASALATAHEAGIIHRDIKPDNVMIRRDGIVKILDFGLAKLSQKPLEIDSEAVTKFKKLTVDGMILGTPQYMSPEQARGQKVDLRTDIFSFGVMLYEMISGKQAFDGVNALDIIGSILKSEPRSLSELIPDISVDLERIVNKALLKDRNLRYQRIEDFLTDLSNVKKNIEIEDVSHNNTTVLKPQKTRENTISVATTRRFSLIHALGFSILALVGFSTIWWFFNGKNMTVATNLKTEEVVNWTSSPGEMYSVGSFSPDGKMVAFSSTKVGSKNIWIKQTSSGEAIQITKDEFGNTNPVWSPNREELAFYSTRGNESGFWRIPTLGGSPKLISKIDDGSSRLLFWSKTGQLYYHSESNIYAVDVVAGTTKQLSNFTAADLIGQRLSVSPDEKTIVYSKTESDGTSIWTMNIEDKITNKILDSKTEIRNLTWHPDSNRVFYSSSVDGTFQIFVTDISSTTPRQLSFSEQDNLVLDVSFDGTNILFGSAKEESDVWGVNLKEPKESIAASDINSELWAEASPDGKTLAYQSISHLSQGNKLFSGNIFSKIIGSNDQPKEIIKNGSLPKWSPDGKMLAFIRANREIRQLETVSLVSSGQKTLTTNEIQSISHTVLPYNRLQTADFSWSPDSSKVAYITKTNGKSNIWSVNSDGSNDAQITENNDLNLNLNCPIWSADGKKIIFSSKTNNSEGKPIHNIRSIDLETKKDDLIFSQIPFIRVLGLIQSESELLFAAAASSGGTTSLTEVSLISINLETKKIRSVMALKDTYLYNIHLSNDKKSIAFTAHREGKDNVWVTPIASGETKQVTNNNDSRLYFSSLSWSPDNNSIFFGKQMRYSLLSMLTNFQ